MAEDDLFRQSIALFDKSVETGYLGDIRNVEAILRLAAMEVFDALPEAVEADTVEDMVYQIGKKHMRAFFGGKNNRGVRGFNEPGGVDVFVAKWTGVKADKPTDRLIGGFSQMISDLLDVEKEAQEQLEEQWRWQVDAIIEHYTLIFMGFTPAQQELMQLP